MILDVKFAQIVNIYICVYSVPIEGAKATAGVDGQLPHIPGPNINNTGTVSTFVLSYHMFYWTKLGSKLWNAPDIRLAG